MTPRWTYDLWAVRMPDGSLLSGSDGPVYFAARRQARVWASAEGGVPIRVSVTVTEVRG